MVFIVFNCDLKSSAKVKYVPMSNKLSYFLYNYTYFKQFTFYCLGICAIKLES